MYLGLAVSLLLHAALMSWALVSISSARDFAMPRTDPVSVEFISPNDLAKMRQGSRRSKLKEAMVKRSEKTDQTPKESRRPTPLASSAPPPADDPPPPAKEEAKPKEEPKPIEQKAAEPPPPKAEPDKAALEQKLAELSKEPVGPSPEDLKKIEEEKAAEHKRAEDQKKAEEERKAEEQKKAEEQRKVEEQRKAEEQRKEEERKAEQHRLEQQRKAEEKRKAEQKRLAEKKKADEKKRREAEAKAKLDLDRLSALIDKSEPRSAPAAAPDPAQQTKAKGPVMGDRDGRDHTISASEASFLAGLMRQAVSRCWNINAGLEGVEKIIVKVQVKLSRDGRLIGPPRVVNSASSPLFADAANSAARALVQCEPYDLPPDKYEGGWEFMELTFDPQRMF